MPEDGKTDRLSIQYRSSRLLVTSRPVDCEGPVLTKALLKLELNWS